MLANAAGPPSILNIEDLSVAYRLGDHWLEVLQEISLSIRQGEIRGLVGESGSGKTTLALAVLRYLGPNGAITAGKIELAGQDLLALDTQAMRQVWGKRITLVPQNAQSSLNPSLRLGEQLAELLIQHEGLDRAAARRGALQWFEKVKLADSQRVAGSFPHQLSGGMQQRALIAMAMCTEPELLILDEPTTGLDVTTQAVILDLVRHLIRERGTAALYVTHNLGVVAHLCDTVSVLYAGELVETAQTQDLLARPLHPYTRGLLDSVPAWERRKRRFNCGLSREVSRPLVKGRAAAPSGRVARLPLKSVRRDLLYSQAGQAGGRVASVGRKLKPSVWMPASLIQSCRSEREAGRRHYRSRF